MWKDFTDAAEFFGALVAAVASVYAVLVARRSHGELLKLQVWSTEETGRINHYIQLAAAIVPEQREIRVHLSRTRALVEKVVAAFGDLVEFQLTRTGVMKKEVLEQTTKALDLYAEYREHLAGNEHASYPDDLLIQLVL